jgi:hypothetical protein
MAIAIPLAIGSYRTFDDLSAGIAAYLDGQVSATDVQAWFGFVEDEINRRLALNPVRPQLTRLTVTMDGEYEALPDDFMKEVSLDFLDGTERCTIRFVDHTGLTDDATNPIPDCWLYSQTADYEGVPEVAAVIEGQLRLFPVPDASYTGTLLYNAKLDRLTDANQTNWFIDAHADVYLYGLMFHANAFLPDRESAAQWFELFDSRLNQVLSAYPKTVTRRVLRCDAALVACR